MYFPQFDCILLDPILEYSILVILFYYVTETGNGILLKPLLKHPQEEYLMKPWKHNMFSMSIVLKVEAHGRKCSRIMGCCMRRLNDNSGLYTKHPSMETQVMTVLDQKL